MPIFVIACLYLHYTAAMTIFGAAAFRLLTPGADAAPIDGILRRLLAADWILALISALVLVMANAGSMGGSWGDAIDPGTIGAVITDTSFGHVWQAHLGVILLAGLALWTTPLARPWFAAAAILMLASLAFIGHAAMVEGPAGDLRRANQAIHLLAGGAWIGGLIPLLLTLRALRPRPLAAAALLHRFSLYGTFALALVLVSGAINAALLVGTANGLLTSLYGRTLLLKLLLVVLMVAIAYRNRFQLTPRLAPDPERIGRRLYRSIAIEIAVGLGIILVASALGTFPPPNA